MTTLSHPSLNTKLKELFELQKRTSDQPYSITHRLELSKAYTSLQYPDLAAGEAYKALLLVDEIDEGDGAYSEQTPKAAITDIQSFRHGGCCSRSAPSVQASEEEEAAIKLAEGCWSKTAYEILVSCLIECGCLRSAFNYVSRALKAFPESSNFQSQQANLLEKLRSHFASENEDFESADIQDYPDRGFVRRELYPWNEHEPDRFSPDVLRFLNQEMERIAPKLEVKAVELPLLSGSSSPTSEIHYVKQLGVFAKESIPPGQKILKEKSFLTAVSRLHDLYCDACSAPLPNLRVSDAHSDHSIDCEECGEVFFCSKRCHRLALEGYHTPLCGIEIEQKTSAKEAADALYTRLLIRALALAETQETHPLELKEVRYIWGEYHGLDLSQLWKPDSETFAPIPRTLPFSFEANILRPLNILEQMEVDIFDNNHSYDTWVFNTLYAKIRGTASAQQGPDGRPEIGAVHPMWCLANHSCDPNVAWEWQGSMRFWTREKLVDFDGRDPEKKPGLQKGEEILGHYCDVRLPVKERREWAIGALGGLCMCPRCVWEDAHEKGQNKNEQ